ncbi:hypothetical protein QI193_02565 [Staphylococcus saprophyticus]|nr:hypothetical protein [Staphylococcus saprophyticus]
MIKMEDKIFVLIFSKTNDEYTVSGYEIGKRTGIDSSLISKLRLGQRDRDGISIRTGRRLEQCYDELAAEGKISWDKNFSSAMDTYEELKRKQ